MLFESVGDFSGTRCKHPLAAGLVLLPLGLLFPRDAGRVAREPTRQAERDKPLTGFPAGAERGVLGQMAPMVRDIRQADAVVHQDQNGGTNQSLRVLAGVWGGGFAAVWQDQRDARLGLYLLRLDGQGQPLEPEFSVNQPTAGRGLDTGVAIAPDGSGAVAWTSPQPATPPIAWVRFFDAQGRFRGPDKAMGAIHHRANARGRQRRAGASQVSVIRRRDGGYAIGWTEDGNVKMLEADASGAWRDQPGVVNPEATKVEPGVRLGVEKSGALLCAWSGGEAYSAVSLGQAPDPDQRLPKGSERSCGEGRLEKIEGDPAGGFWGLFETVPGTFALRHLSPAGEVDPEVDRLVQEGLSGADIAVWRGGVAFLAERASGALELALLDAGGRRTEESPTAVNSPEARAIGNAKVASNGARLYVAWTDARNRDRDVYARIVDPSAPPEKRLGPERRLNTDSASSGQTKAAIGGSTSGAVIAWQDDRELQPRVYARRVSWPGGFSGDEFQLPLAASGAEAPVPASPRFAPAVSVHPDGRFLIAWSEGSGQEIKLCAQAFGKDGRPMAEPTRIGVLERAPPIAVAVLPEDSGYFVVWDDESAQSLLAARLSPEGALASAPRTIVQAKEGLGEPAVAVMVDGRVLAAWSQKYAKDGWRVRARHFDYDGKPDGAEIGFDRTVRGQDWDPSIAPADRGGFAMSWCSGARDDPGKDVVARVFDAKGRPAGTLLPISPTSNEQDYPNLLRLADGSWVVAWEDDISAHDHAYLRRIDRNGRDLGPIVRVNELETAVIEDRQAPFVAPLADGIAVIWGDRRRSKGWDVFTKLLGPRFDAVSGN